MGKYLLVIISSLMLFSGLEAGGNGCSLQNNSCSQPSCNTCHYDSGCDYCDGCGKSCGFGLYEVGIFTGYGRGGLHTPQDDYEVIPAFLRFGFNINHLFGCGCSYGTFSFNIEPFVNYVNGPHRGFELGSAFMFMYSKGISDSVKIYIEGGVAPMYLTIETIEQDQEGFNFLDQGGAGLQFCLSSSCALTVGYRFRHISHADLRHASNDGINTHAGIIGLSRFY